jgi:hypothetical protein
MVPSIIHPKWSDPMHRRWFLVLTAASVVAALPASARPTISTDAAPGVNFQTYKTFSWVNPTPPAGMDPVAFGRIRSEIEDDLAAKGYQSASPGDLSLILTVGERQKTDFESWGRFGLQTSAYTYTQGSLSLDAFDTKTRQAVWHGQATETVNPDKPNFGAIRDGIDKMVGKFPAGGGAPPPAATTPK